MENLVCARCGHKPKNPGRMLFWSHAHEEWQCVNLSRCLRRARKRRAAS